jgi:hypothetical protein
MCLTLRDREVAPRLKVSPELAPLAPLPLLSLFLFVLQHTGIAAQDFTVSEKRKWEFLPKTSYESYVWSLFEVPERPSASQMAGIMVSAAVVVTASRDFMFIPLSAGIMVAHRLDRSARFHTGLHWGGTTSSTAS